MDVIGVLVAAIWNPIRQLVCRLRRIEDGEAKQLLLDLRLSDSRNNELNQQVKALTQDVHHLSRSKELLEVRLEQIQHQLCSELERSGSYVDGSATPSLLESNLKTLRASVSHVAKVFVDLMKSNGLDHGFALMTHFKGIYLTRPAHVNFMLKAWICSVLFEHFENESFLPGGATLFLDSNERKSKSFQYYQRIVTTDSCDYLTVHHDFETFCRQKLFCFLALWQSREGKNRNTSFFHVTDAFFLADVESLEPRTRELIQGFISAVKVVWAIHKLCLSFEPVGRIFRVGLEDKFNEDYMNSVVSEDEDPKFVSEVGFMIFPGFGIRKSIVKCQIYLHAIQSRRATYDNYLESPRLKTSILSALQ